MTLKFAPALAAPILAIAAFGAMMPVLARAAGADAAPADKLRAAIVAAGCVVTVQNGDAVQKASGLSAEEVKAAVAALYAAGDVTLEPDGTMKLVGGGCS